jgi:NADPH2:quinone reductase
LEEFMRAVIYTTPGGPEVLELVEREVPLPQPHEVLVQLHVSGVNPTDWKSRRGSGATLAFPEIVPNQDGAGVITAVGSQVPQARVGERVWVYEAGHERAFGTAEEYIAIDERHAIALPEGAPFDLGAALGVPAITAHRCLTVGIDGPRRLGPGELAGQTVLVAGGAGAVGHMAIELARWSGATVIATVSSASKGELATAAGADFVLNYRDNNITDQVRSLAPNGVDLIVEVSAVVNADLNVRALKASGTIAIYASGNDPLMLDIRTMMKLNARIQFVYLYTVPRAAKELAIEDITRAIEDGALSAGAHRGLPLIRFSLDDTSHAHRAVEDGAIGKVLIDVIHPSRQSDPTES